MAKTATKTATKSASEIFTELTVQWNEFVAAHTGTKKKNAAEARKALGEIKKLVTPYRAASVEAVKALKA